MIDRIGSMIGKGLGNIPTPTNIDRSLVMQSQLTRNGNLWDRNMVNSWVNNPFRNAYFFTYRGRYSDADFAAMALYANFYPDLRSRIEAAAQRIASQTYATSAGAQYNLLQSFIKYFPNSSYAQTAQSTINRLTFLNPDGVAESAQLEADWSNTIRTNTLVSLRAFIEKYQSSNDSKAKNFVVEAKRRIEAIYNNEFNRISDSRNGLTQEQRLNALKDLERSIEQNSDIVNSSRTNSITSTVTNQANQLEQQNETANREAELKAAFESAQRQDSIIAYQAFLDKYQSNPSYTTLGAWRSYSVNAINRIRAIQAQEQKKQEEEANALAELQAWQAAMTVNTIQAYQNFANRFVFSKYRPEALARIRALEAQQFAEKAANEEEKRRLEELKRQQDLARQQELQRLAEEERQRQIAAEQAAQREAELNRIRLAEEQARLQADQEAKRLRELQAQAEQERLRQIQQQEEARRQEELRRQQEELRAQQEAEFAEQQALQEQALQAEQTAWNNAQSVNTREAYEAYLAQYPNGLFAFQAQQEIDRLIEESFTNPSPITNPIDDIFLPPDTTTDIDSNSLIDDNTFVSDFTPTPTLTENGDGTATFTDEDGIETLLVLDPITNEPIVPLDDSGQPVIDIEEARDSHPNIPVTKQGINQPIIAKNEESGIFVMLFPDGTKIPLETDVETGLPIIPTDENGLPIASGVPLVDNEGNVLEIINPLDENGNPIVIDEASTETALTEGNAKKIAKLLAAGVAVGVVAAVGGVVYKKVKGKKKVNPKAPPKKKTGTSTKRTASKPTTTRKSSTAKKATPKKKASPARRTSVKKASTRKASSARKSTAKKTTSKKK